MRAYATRYYTDSRPDSTFSIVLFSRRERVLTNPHDWQWRIELEDWEMMGCRVPNEREVMPVSMLMEESQ